MTVSELIAALTALPGDLIVQTDAGQYEGLEIVDGVRQDPGGYVVLEHSWSSI